MANGTVLFAAHAFQPCYYRLLFFAHFYFCQIMSGENPKSIRLVGVPRAAATYTRLCCLSPVAPPSTHCICSCSSAPTAFSTRPNSQGTGPKPLKLTRPANQPNHCPSGVDPVFCSVPPQKTSLAREPPTSTSSSSHPPIRSPSKLFLHSSTCLRLTSSLNTENVSLSVMIPS